MDFRKSWLFGALLASAFSLAYSSSLFAKTDRISVASDGTEGNSHSRYPRMSGDGRFVVFHSSASNLVPGDANGLPDVFLYDTQSKKITRISVGWDGKESDGWSENAVISEDGRYVAFSSSATNLVKGDSNGTTDIFRYEIATKKIERVSLAQDGLEANDWSRIPGLSEDGEKIIFTSSASNLVPNDTNDVPDIFVRDMKLGTTTRVSVASDGTEGNGWSYCYSPQLVGKGNLAIFASGAGNLVPGDTNKTDDVFVHDLTTRTTRRVSIATDGTEGNSSSYFPSASRDGRFVVFESYTNNLVPGGERGNILVRDLLLNTTSQASVSNEGEEIAGSSAFEPAISKDGRYVVFAKFKGERGTLSRDRSNIYIRDLLGQKTYRIPALDGAFANEYSAYPAINGDGKWIAFESIADNLILGDSNKAVDLFFTPNTLLPDFTIERIPRIDRFKGFAKFDASASSGDRTIVSYHWNFGDGATATGRTAFHFYRENGTYTVSLTVEDDEGSRMSMEKNVTISGLLR